MSQSHPGAGFSFWESVLDFVVEVLKAVAFVLVVCGITYILTVRL